MSCDGHTTSDVAPVLHDVRALTARNLPVTHHPGMAPHPRTARLRPEYAEWYPRVEAGRWHDAAYLTEVVRRQLSEGSPAWAPGGRILSDMHFEFEGGRPGPNQGAERRGPGQV